MRKNRQTTEEEEEEEERRKEKYSHLPRLFGQLGGGTQGVVIIGSIRIFCRSSTTAGLALTFERLLVGLVRLELAAHRARLLPFQVGRDELETAPGHRFGVAQLAVNVRHPQEEEAAQAVGP